MGLIACSTKKIQILFLYSTVQIMAAVRLEGVGLERNILSPANSEIWTLSFLTPFFHIMPNLTTPALALERLLSVNGNQRDT